MRHALLGLAAALAGGFLLAQAPPTNPTPPPGNPAPPAANPAPPPAAGGPATTDMFPTKKGTKWVYKVGESEVTLQAGETDAKGETKLETIVTGKPVASESILVKEDGVYRTKINNSPIEPPVKILELVKGPDGKLTAKPQGTKWNVKSKVLQADLTGDFTIGKTEASYDVLGTKYANAVVVEGPNFMIAGTETKVTYVFAPGKGVVKLSYAIGGNGTNLELRSFEEGK